MFNSSNVLIFEVLLLHVDLIDGRTFLGCYRDKGKMRDLGHLRWKTNALTLDKCDLHCFGYHFFGVQVSITNYIYLFIF